MVNRCYFLPVGIVDQDRIFNWDCIVHLFRNQNPDDSAQLIADKSFCISNLFEAVV